ncbi:hypothetical protein [Sporosarcina koreensis]|uniref:hypothetical protein n=1 Tax=Sporosarcina koreensis TaxID=334735 RepID=UPI00058F0DA7|nr:hypothetical protein [Sporosarcina koreensis]
MKQKIDELLDLKDKITRNQLRSIVATNLVKYCLDYLKQNDRNLALLKVTERINFSLESNGIQPISHSFVRKVASKYKSAC